MCGFRELYEIHKMCESLELCEKTKFIRKKIPGPGKWHSGTQTSSLTWRPFLFLLTSLHISSEINS